MDDHMEKKEREADANQDEDVMHTVELWLHYKFCILQNN